MARTPKSARVTLSGHGVIAVRAGGNVLGTLAGVGAIDQDWMGGIFRPTPAFMDFIDRFEAMAAARKDAAPQAPARAQAIAAELEAGGVHVADVANDMRIDHAGSLVIDHGEARFRPTQSFLMMRSGGH